MQQHTRHLRRVIPLPDGVRSALRVHFRADAPPDPSELAPEAPGLVAAMPAGAFRDALAEVLARRGLALDLLTPEQWCEPSIDALLRPGLGPQRETALRNATHALEVASLDRVDGAPEGLSLVEVVACGLAQRLDGVVVDPFAVRALGRRECERLRKGAGRPPIADRLRVTTEARGHGVTVASAGMAKFGLPDLELADVPADLEEPAAALLLGLAHVLLRLLNEQAGLRRTPLTSLETPGDVRVAREDVIHAGCGQAVRASEGGAGWARVPLAVDEGPDGRPRALRVGPPEGLERGWLRHAIEHLLGPCPAASVSGHRPEAAAMRTALSMEDAAERYRVGRESGVALRVLVEFPTTDGGSEPLWVRVAKWEGVMLEGALCDPPHRRLDLAPNRHVTVHDSHVAAWRLLHPDGRREEGGDLGPPPPGG